LVRTLFGLDYLAAGSIEFDGQKIHGSVKARMNAGIGLLSEDRKHEGLAQELPIIENTTLGSLGRYTRFGLINLRAREKAAIDLMKTVEVKAHSEYQNVSELSGGNQQKVAIARILHQNAKLLIMDEPTKGIDVGTKSEIYRMMGELAAAGKTVLFISSYLPELLAVCDRIGVMARGGLKEIRDAADWSEDSIMSVATSSER
jgi:ribose transport system ATP-binding protein